MSDTSRGLLRHHLLWGLGLGAAEVACIQILTWIGLGLSHLTWILIFVLVVIFAVLSGRSLVRRLGSRPGFLRAVVLMLVVILVSRAIYQVYMVIYINYVDPTWVDTVAEVWTEQLQNAGATAEQIGDNINRFRREWELPHALTLGIINYGITQFFLGMLFQILFVVQPWKRTSTGLAPSRG